MASCDNDGNDTSAATAAAVRVAAVRRVAGVLFFGAVGILAHLAEWPSGGSELAARSACGGDIRPGHVVGDHPIGAEAPAQRPDRPFHPGNPLTRQTIGI